jgi:cell division protein FtsW (lipid II flippase)
VNENTRRESILLLFGFLFQAVGAAAGILSASVENGVWTVEPASLGILIPLTAWTASAVILHRRLNRRLPNRDPFLFPSAMFLSGWGLQILFRLSPATAYRQTLWLIAAGAVLLFLLHLPDPIEWFRRYRYLWLLAALLALAATFFVGIASDAGSPRLWLGLAGVYLQPSEMLRWIFPVFAAFSLAGRRTDDSADRNRILSLIILALAGLGLLVMQPDLGAFLLLFASLVVVVYLAHPRPVILAAGVAAVLLGGVLGFAINAVVRARILTWWNPWVDAANTSYQVVQSLIAFSAGGLIGRGPGLGAPGLVPVAHSDFLFTALGEEYGVVGAVGCLLVISILVLRGLTAAARSARPVGRLLAGVLSAMLGLQSMLIIGGVLRLLPLTGVTLPWMSYGGSSLIACTVMLALLLILSDRTGTSDCPPDTDRPMRVLAFLQIAAVLAAAVSLGWWGVYRAPVLRTRTDNARRVLHDARIRRGNLFDRSGEPLALTVGDPGEYVRQYPDPAAAPVVGYSSARYGQSGMESALDAWLRGDASRNAFEIWWSETVLGQGSEGASVRLTIDRSLQDAGKRLLGSRNGSIVVLDAESGEILALVTEPTYDPGKLEEDWDSLLDDPGAPLLNRATQGLYPPGVIFLPFLAAQAAEKDPAAVEGGICDLPVAFLLDSDPLLLSSTLRDFRFDQAPVMNLPTAYAPLDALPRTAGGLFPPDGTNGGILLSPMQVALGLAAIATDGLAPAPLLVHRMETADGWIGGSAPGHPMAMLTADTAMQIRSLLVPSAASDTHIVYYFPACPLFPTNTAATWFAGFRKTEAGTVVVVVAMEGNHPETPGIGKLMLELSADLPDSGG